MKRSALPAIDAYTQRCVESGLVCISCGHEFVKPHGRKVACTYCYPKLTLAEQREVVLATHEEKGRAAHAALARRTRLAKAARQQRKFEHEKGDAH